MHDSGHGLYIAFHVNCLQGMKSATNISRKLGLFSFKKRLKSRYVISYDLVSDLVSLSDFARVNIFCYKINNDTDSGICTYVGLY